MGTTATLYGLTLPGATCSPSVVFDTGFTPSDLSTADETAAGDGTVSWTFTVSADSTVSGTGGTGTVTCTYGTQTLTATTSFTVQARS
jgi:hypothetical protein